MFNRYHLWAVGKFEICWYGPESFRGPISGFVNREKMNQYGDWLSSQLKIYKFILYLWSSHNSNQWCPFPPKKPHREEQTHTRIVFSSSAWSLRWHIRTDTWLDPWIWFARECIFWGLFWFRFRVGFRFDQSYILYFLFLSSLSNLSESRYIHSILFFVLGVWGCGLRLLAGVFFCDLSDSRWRLMCQPSNRRCFIVTLCRFLKDFFLNPALGNRFLVTCYLE